MIVHLTSRRAIDVIIRMFFASVLAALAATVNAVDVVAPNANLKAENIPPIPASLADKVAPYTEFKPATAVSWHPKERELVVARRAGNTTQLHRVGRPLHEPQQLTEFAEPVRYGIYWPKSPNALVFSRDTGGNEQQQLYRLDSREATPVLLTDAARKHQPAGLTRSRELLLLETTDVDKTGKREKPMLDLSLLDPLDPARSRKLATLPGTGWGDFTFSFDDKRLAMVEFISVNESYVWLMDVATGERKRTLPTERAATQSVDTRDLNFSRDGKGLFLSTDRDGEFRKLAYLDLESGKLEYFGAGGDWDVEDIALSPDGRTLAVITNEAGVGVLRLYDAETRRVLPQPSLPVGSVRGLVWHENSRDLAVSVNSAQSPNDVYAFDVRDNKVARWTETKVAGLDATKFRNAEPIQWKSFDDRTIGGFIVRPSPQKYQGRRPVIVSIHGGPEAQARPGFLGRWNYFVDEMGIAIIEPNVRGSTGYGKTFVALDNGVKREDSVKDIGALLEWIRTQPDLDADRVVVEGGSYGGYMVLAVATNYPTRIKGAIDIVGVANFVSFLENTESYRRDLRRVEYGDERDAVMRAFLTKISPVNNADKIRAPLFIVQGKNDPRVPYTEAEQIVAAARKNGVPVWYLLADNEGHGFARKANADFLFYAMIAFVEERLLKTALDPRERRVIVDRLEVLGLDEVSVDPLVGR